MSCRQKMRRGYLHRIVMNCFIISALLFILANQADSFLLDKRSLSRIPKVETTLLVEKIGIDLDKTDSSVSINEYQHKDWKCTYRYKPAAKGHENKPAIILIHPVGVGISSWFWDRVMADFNDDNPAIYAPDLIGCGIENGADPWKPDEKGLFFPLSWVEGVESLINNIVLPNRPSSFPWNSWKGNDDNDGGCTIVVQGGLAPVGVMLAARNEQTVSKLILTSPPTFDDMTTAVPQSELERNYNFLRSKMFGPLAFGVLEKRQIVEFFSDLFLFKDKCDDEWLDRVEEGSLKESRAPIEAFNAGLLQHRSFEEELTSIEQKTAIVQGDSDKRQADRVQFSKDMKRCDNIIITGCNVLPWENAEEMIDLLRKF